MLSLKYDYDQLIDILENNVSESSIDTRKYNFLAPTTLIPLIYFHKKWDKELLCAESTYDYVKHIVNKKNNKSTFFVENLGKYYMGLPIDELERQNKDLSLKFAEKLDNRYGGLWFQNYILSELTSNIYEHAYKRGSLSDIGINYAQIFPKSKRMEICIFDAGKTIPGNYEEHNISFDDDCHALELMLSRKSTGYCTTFDDYRDQRGNGIRSIVKKLITENKGEFLIASRRAYLHIKTEDDYSYNLGREFPGTLITLRLKKNEVKCLMDSAELEFENPYVYRRV